jgi:hypothetical protein
MNIKKVVSIFTVVLIMILTSILSIVIYKQYYQTEKNTEQNNKVQKNLNIFIDTNNPIVRIGVLSSNGIHYEITDKEAINKVVNNLNGLSLSLDETAEKNIIPGYRYNITMYTYWDKVVWTGGIVDETYIRYNDFYYNIDNDTFNLTYFQELLK